MVTVDLSYEEWAGTVRRSPNSRNRCASVSEVHEAIGRPLTWDKATKRWTGTVEGWRALADALAERAEDALAGEERGDRGGITSKNTRLQARKLLAVAGKIDAAMDRGVDVPWDEAKIRRSQEAS